MSQIDLNDLKQMLAENCMLKVNLDEIDAETPLFGPNSVGLDSLDALQLTVGIEKRYGVPINDPEIARQVLENLGTLRTWLSRQNLKVA